MPVLTQANDIQNAVARALVATHAHHGVFYGAPRADGKVPLVLLGRDEYADHSWLIAPDGTGEDDDAR